MKKTLRLILVILLWFSLVWSIAPAKASFPSSRSLPQRGEVISASLRTAIDTLQASDTTTVIVTLRDQADLRQTGPFDRPGRLRQVIAALKTTANQSQRGLIRRLERLQSEGQVDQFTPLWVFNGLSVKASAEAIQELAARPEVLSISVDEIDVVPAAPLAYASPEPNLSLINAPALWDMGYLGQGVVVASMDTGVDLTHSDLAGRWRGGTNSWFDPYGQHPTTPTDLSGHGTWTMGVMVGGEAGGTSIGVAPQAKWISVKIFNDQGTSTATAIHQGFQWLLDPDGDPATADAPHVVNNSWAFGAPGCNLEFQLDLQSLRAAGILPVFAAGNYGPNGSTSVSPANYPEAFAVGAINNINRIYGYSSRGPSACGEAQTVFPELVAPGVNEKTTDLLGSYYWATGTSLAAPHVTGALALLLNAFPSLPVAQQEAALKNSAANLGVAGPDNTFGYGRLDVLAAYNMLLNGEPTATPTATSPISSPTSSPTPTPSPSSLPSASPTPTSSPTPTLGPTASPSSTPSPSPTPTSPPSSSPTPTTTPTQSPTPAVPSGDSLFADGFEGGNFSTWSAELDTENDLNVSAEAALADASGMAALIDNKTAMYVQDDSPVSESRYRARFYFDPNSLSMASGNMHTIFLAHSATLDLITIDLRFASGAYQIRGLIRTDLGSTLTPWVPISDAPHTIEIDWAAATSAGANNGFFTLWVDGIQAASLTGIDNDTHRVELARLGPSAGIDAGTSGTEFFDAFVSTRSMYIGP